jgi:hypothetical protein
VLRKTPRKSSCVDAEDSTKRKAPDHAKHCLTQAVIALVAFTTASIFVPLSAMADSPDVRVTQEATSNQDTAEESDRTNNGNDLTRPQNSFEMRLTDQTSSNDTSEANRAAMLLRLNSKITFDAGWRLALLAQVPVVAETTTAFDPLSVDHEFGLGDAAFQMILARAINERWAVGIGARLVARTAGQRQMANHAGVWCALFATRLGIGQLFRPSSALRDELRRGSDKTKN